MPEAEQHFSEPAPERRGLQHRQAPNRRQLAEGEDLGRQLPPQHQAADWTAGLLPKLDDAVL